jgi:hypothetical protein
MKTFILTTILVALLIGHCMAGTAVLPEIPAPKLTASQAIEVAKQRMGDSTNFTLVGIDWCKSSTFQPRFNDGTQYSPGKDHPDDYSWFLTYVYKDDQMEKGLTGMGIKRQFNAVHVIRVKDDGQIGAFVGFRA